MKYYPEGVCPSLNKKFYSFSALKSAIKNRNIYEGRVYLCDGEHNLFVDLGGYHGVIPRAEGAYGILEGTVRDIALISKVNRRVCFRIMGLHREHGELVPILSRRSVQRSCLNEYIDRLNPGDIIPARVTRLEEFGAFIDIGCGINSLIPIDLLSVSRISSPADRLFEGEIIKAVLKTREPEKLTFSLKELLGTWEENAAFFNSGDTVTGVIRGVEPYGTFIELAPNFTGLAEALEGAECGQRVSVYIKSINPQRMKIKLSVVEAFGEKARPGELHYFIDSGHIDEWRYSPAGAQKQLTTRFPTNH